MRDLSRPFHGGESFPGIAHGLVSLGEPFRLREPEEPVREGMKRCTKCGRAKPVGDYHRKAKDGGDGPENRVARCKECQSAEATTVSALEPAANGSKST